MTVSTSANTAIAEEKDSTSVSEEEQTTTEEHKHTPFELLPRQSPMIAPKSTSMMRSFERRPEYNVYYPPASLQEVFSGFTLGPTARTEQEQSVSLSTNQIKEGEGDGPCNGRPRVCSVDELFEMASVTLDYNKFYGFAPENEFSKTMTRTMDTAVLRVDTEGSFLVPEVSAMNSLQESHISQVSDDDEDEDNE